MGGGQRPLRERVIRQGRAQLGAHHGGAHGRRYHEVRQVAEVLRGLGIEPTITSATERFFERSGQLGLTAAEKADDVIRTFNERL